MPSLRHPQGDGQQERTLAAPHIAAKHNEVAQAESTAKQLVETRVAGGNGVGRERAIRHSVYAAKQEGKG